jgi:hypothetical protein
MRTQHLVVDAILVPSFHTLASVLWVPGLAHEPKWAGRKSLTDSPFDTPQPRPVLSCPEVPKGRGERVIAQPK